MRKNAVRLALVMVGSLILNACITAGAYFGDTTVPKDDTLIVGNQSDPRSLDPHKTAGIPESNIMLNLYDGLTTYDAKTGEPVPCLATSWDVNEDASVWTFHLRPEAKWTDGTPLTAEDFVWSWRRIVNPETASPYANLLYYVKNGQALGEGAMTDLTQLGVVALDAHTLRVELEQPTAFFLAMTPHYAFTAVPRQAIEKYGDQWTDPANHVSSGPYRLISRVAYDRIILERWDEHWDAANVRIKRVVFLPIEDQNTAVNLYKAGELHVTMGGGQSVPKAFVKALRGKRDFSISPNFAVYYYSINTQKKPFDDIRVRQALNMAVDKQAICDKILLAGQSPAYNWVPPGLPGYPYPDGPKYDPEKARKLLAEAGYPGGKGFPEVQIYFNTLEAHRQVAEAIQSMWKRDLGIPVKLANQEWQVFQATREQRRFDIARDGWVADYFDPSTFLADLFAADTLNNHSGWVRPKFTDFVTRGNGTADPAERYKLLAQAEQVLLDEMPVIPLYFYASVKLKKPFVEGFYSNPLDQHPMKAMWINHDWKPSPDDAIEK